jgi:hypothetical protein
MSEIVTINLSTIENIDDGHRKDISKQGLHHDILGWDVITFVSISRHLKSRVSVNESKCPSSVMKHFFERGPNPNKEKLPK